MQYGFFSLLNNLGINNTLIIITSHFDSQNVEQKMKRLTWDSRSTALASHCSSSSSLNSAWTIVLLSTNLASSHLWKWDIPSPCLPMYGKSMISLSLRFLSAWLSHTEAYHFLPDLVLMPASWTLRFLESLKFIVTLHFNPWWWRSSRLQMGSCNCPDLMIPDVQPDQCKTWQNP